MFLFSSQLTGIKKAYRVNRIDEIVMVLEQTPTLSTPSLFQRSKRKNAMYLAF